MMISPEQIKAARAMLDWTQDTLAQACGLSLATIHNLEKGHLSPRSSSEVLKTFEKMGFEFFGDNGLRLCKDETRTYEGVGSCDKFYGEMLATVKEKGGEIIAIVKSQKILSNCLGASDPAKSERLEQLSKFATVKCLLIDAPVSSTYIPSFQFKGLSNYPITQWSTITYDDKTVIVFTKNNVEFVYVVIKSIDVAQKGFREFESLWATAFPLAVQSEPLRRRA